ncbi:MAG: class I SAM-dependent methyltransferase [Clostridiales bacterium]|jgi:tRNA (adenine22-N1)-methyltransferase|nr:class I SAM-dependent methyltransferase [Clostridiales bacterium]
MKRLFALAPRLRAVADMLRARSMCDVGCDHAMLPVWLAATGRIDRAAACDIAPGPLAAARRKIDAWSLGGVVETRLGNGLRAVAPGEFEECVIAGMGGLNIIEILEAAPETARAFSGIVLVPHRDWDRVAEWAAVNGRIVTAAARVIEGKKIYNILRIENSIQ